MPWCRAELRLRGPASKAADVAPIDNNALPPPAPHGTLAGVIVVTCVNTGYKDKGHRNTGSDNDLTQAHDLPSSQQKTSKIIIGCPIPGIHTCVYIALTMRTALRAAHANIVQTSKNSQLLCGDQAQTALRASRVPCCARKNIVKGYRRFFSALRATHDRLT